MHGLIVSAPKYAEEFYRVMIPLVKEGVVHNQEDVPKGLETAEKGLLDVLQGRNKEGNLGGRGMRDVGCSDL